MQEKGFFERLFKRFKCFERFWAYRKLLSFKNTLPLWALIELKWRQFLTCIIYALHSHQAIFIYANQAMPANSLCAQDDFFPRFPVLSVRWAVTKGNYFCILGYRIGTSEMCFTEDFQTWLAKNQKGLFSLLYTSISSRSASVTAALCHAWLQVTIVLAKVFCVSLQNQLFGMTSKGGSKGSSGRELFHRVLWKEKVYILDFCSLLSCIPGKTEIQLYWFQARSDTWNMEQEAEPKECKTDSRHRTDVQCPAVL